MFPRTLCSLCAALAVFAASSEVSAPTNPVEYFPLENVRLTDGPFKVAQDRDIEYILALDPDRLLAPYRREAGLPTAAENYTNWENTGLDGHIGGHYLSAFVQMYAATADTVVRDRLFYFLAELKACQDAASDGYLCGVPGGRAMWADVAAGHIRAGAFDLNGKWVPLYNIHKTFAGLRDAWVYTRNPLARDMLVRLADWMLAEVSRLSDSQIQEMLRSEHGGLNEVFADVAVITGDEKYLDLAHRFSHLDILNPLLQGSCNLTGKHANTQIPKVIGFKRIADIDGSEGWSEAARSFWLDVVSRRSVSIGGNSVREHFHSPDDFSSMLESEQGPETCNTYNMLRLSRMLQQSDPDPAFTEYIERAVFNHILSSQNPAHGGFVYFTPMRPGHYRVYSQPQTSFWCCVGSGMENHARYGEYIYARDSSGNIFVNLFIPSVLSTPGLSLTQSTSFPESGTVSFAVSPAKPSRFALNIRVPQWTDPSSVSVSVNGKQVRPAFDGPYISLSRKWKPADSVTVSFPMSLRLEQLPDSSANYSILYGPIVLAASLGSDAQDGLFADDSRGGHIAAGPKLPLQDMPVIVSSPDSILSCIARIPGDSLAFSLSSVYPTAYDGICLVPFASLCECRYIVYWPVIGRGELAGRMAAVARRQEQERRLESITADLVVCGEQQPESDHFISQLNSSAGVRDDVHFRSAAPGGWFAYVLSAPSASEPSAVRIHYLPAPGSSAQVWLGDVLLGSLPEVSSSDGEQAFADFPIPAALSPDSKLSLKIAAGEVSTPPVLAVRLLREGSDAPAPMP